MLVVNGSVTREGALLQCCLFSFNVPSETGEVALAPSTQLFRMDGKEAVS